MHIHPNQINPNTELDALYAAGKAAAKREAERTRRKLQEFAAKIAGENVSGEDCIVQLGPDEDRKQQNRPDRRKSGNTKRESKSISDYA
ncbi:MAG: hypothetical protein WAL56_09650 [Candidatus Sulfotelmatobacter sp.]